jgi:hypothetical protein
MAFGARAFGAPTVGDAVPPSVLVVNDALDTPLPDSRKSY